MIVVGAGNAAHAAAVSAGESGARRVLMLEKAPEALRGGNTHYSGGLLRLAFDTPDALLRLIPDVQTEFPDFLAGVWWDRSRSWRTAGITFFRHSLLDGRTGNSHGGSSVTGSDRV